MTTQKAVRGKTSRKRPLFAVSLVAVIALVGLLFVSELTNVTHLFHSEAPTKQVTASQDTKGELPKSNTSTAKNSPTQTPNTQINTGQPSDNKSTSGGNTDTNLIEPSGTFVSAHNVPTSVSLASVCNTTPGATCKIDFTKDGVIKELPSETTDGGGSAYWNSWTPASLGLTSGNWQITAIAQLGTQTKTSVDALPLKVSE
jgi:hypothetical protein